MTALIDFLPKVNQYAPGCAEPAAFDALRAAAAEFCERTGLWRATLTINTASQEPDIMALPADSTMHAIELVLFNGRELERVTPEYLDERFSTWRTETATGEPQYITQLVQDEIRLYPFADGEVSAFVRLKPTANADTLPDFLADRYRDTLQAGALAKILLLPGQPFTNPDLAMMFHARFQADLDRLFDAKSRGQQRAPARTKPAFF